MLNMGITHFVWKFKPCPENPRLRNSTGLRECTRLTLDRQFSILKIQIIFKQKSEISKILLKKCKVSCSRDFLVLFRFQTTNVMINVHLRFCKMRAWHELSMWIPTNFESNEPHFVFTPKPHPKPEFMKKRRLLCTTGIQCVKPLIFYRHSSISDIYVILSEKIWNLTNSNKKMIKSFGTRHFLVILRFQTTPVKMNVYLALCKMHTSNELSMQILEIFGSLESPILFLPQNCTRRATWILEK